MVLMDELDYTDVFFAYADNTLCNCEFKYFKALINFYLIFSGRIIVPDSFLLNNINFQKLLLNDDNNNETEFIGYLREGFLIPAIRENIDSVSELHKHFSNKNDCNTSIDYAQLLDDNLNHILGYDIDGVTEEFSYGVKSILNMENFEETNLDSLLNKGLRDTINNIIESQGTISRLDIYNALKKYYAINPIAADLFRKLVDNKYRFNLADYYNIHAAYPNLEKNRINSIDLVKQIYLGDTNSDLECTTKEHQIRSILFDIGFLNSLTFADILEIRKLKQYKNFISGWNTWTEKCISSKSDMFNEFLYNFNNFNNEVEYLAKLMKDRSIYDKFAKQDHVLKVAEKTVKCLNYTTSIALSFVPGVDWSSNLMAFGVGESLTKWVSSKKRRLENEAKIRAFNNEQSMLDIVTGELIGKSQEKYVGLISSESSLLEGMN